MGDDERLPPLSRRVPDENRGHKPAARVSPLQLPDEVVARMLAAVRAGAAEDAAVQDAAAPKAAASQPSGPQAAQPPVAAAQAAAAETQDRPNRHKLESPRLARKRAAHGARQAEEKRRAEDKRQAEQDRQARAEENQRAARERVAADAARQEPATVARPRTAVDRPGPARDDETAAAPEAARAAGPRGFGRLRNRRLDLDLDRRADDDTDQFPAIAPEAAGISGRETAGASAPRVHETRPAAAASATVLPTRTPKAPAQPAAAASPPVLPTRIPKAQPPAEPAQPAAAPKAPPQPARPAAAASAPVLPARTPQAQPPAEPAQPAAASAPVLPVRTPQAQPPAEPAQSAAVPKAPERPARPAAAASAPVLPARTPQAQPPAEPAQPAAAASAPVLPARTPREPAQPAAAPKAPRRPATAARAPAQPVRTPPERSARPARGQAAPAAEARPPQVGQRYRLAGAAAAVIAVAAGVVALVVSRPTSPESSATAHTEVLQRAAMTRGQTAAWIASQISRATVVSCDPAMCTALQSHGFPAAELVALKPGVSPLHSVLIVATATIRKQLGSQLSATYAPAVIARFGSGDQHIDIRAVAPHGAPAYKLALSSDLGFRREIGNQLVSNSRIGFVGTTGTQLAAGMVDSRVIFTLLNLAVLRPIQIVAFGDGAPGVSARTSPLRSVEVQQVPNGPNWPNAQFVSGMLARLRAQQPPYVYASARELRLGGGTFVLRIDFSAPSPLGLLGAAAPSTG